MVCASSSAAAAVFTAPWCLLLAAVVCSTVVIASSPSSSPNDDGYFGLDGDNNLLIRPPSGGQVVVDGIVLQELVLHVQRLDQELNETRAKTAQLERELNETRMQRNETRANAAAEPVFWAHNDPDGCAVFTPTVLPLTVHVAVGGGGGGGGEGHGNDGSPGGRSTVTLVVNGVDGDNLMYADGGAGGRKGNADSRGQAQATGGSTLNGAIVVPGGGGTGGDPGVDNLSSLRTGTAGLGGGYVFGLVTLTSNQQLRACVGNGGQGGGGAGDAGAAGADGFVIISA